MKKEKIIQPNRFVYHLSYKQNRSGILKNGIVPKSENGFVYAHNSSIFWNDWYKINLEEPDTLFDLKKGILYHNELKALKSLINDNYDIWKIDTWQLESNWEIDEIGTSEAFLYNSKIKFQRKDDFYIRTKQNISANVLTCCNLGENIETLEMYQFGINCTLYYYRIEEVA